MKKKIILLIGFIVSPIIAIIMLALILTLLIMVAGINNGSDNVETMVELSTESIQETEQIKESESETKVVESEVTESTGAYGWTISDYTEFHAALKTIADIYVTNYKMPSYNKWKFVKFDEDRIFAITDEFIFKDDHEKHVVVCVFSLFGDTDNNGFHEGVKWNYFCIDEKVYYDDGSCDEVFEKLKPFIK